MIKQILLLSAFLILSFFIFFFSKSLSSPVDFLSSLFSFPRASLYGFAHAQSAPTEYEKLQDENKKLREKLTELNFLRQDNAALRSQFQDTTIPSEKLLPAKIVGFKGSIFAPSSFILNQGEKSNIKKGMGVIAGHELVGKIWNVSRYYSEVILPTNKDFSTLGVSAENNTPGIVAGQEDLILFGDVVITDTISKNETIETKGEKDVAGIGLPAGLIIGKVKTVNKSETQPFQSAVVESLVDFKKLTTVFIITN